MSSLSAEPVAVNKIDEMYEDPSTALVAVEHIRNSEAALTVVQADEKCTGIAAHNLRIEGE